MKARATRQLVTCLKIISQCHRSQTLHRQNTKAQTRRMSSQHQGRVCTLSNHIYCRMIRQFLLTKQRSGSARVSPATMTTSRAITILLSLISYFFYGVLAIFPLGGRCLCISPSQKGSAGRTNEGLWDGQDQCHKGNMGRVRMLYSFAKSQRIVDFSSLPLSAPQELVTCLTS